MVTVEWTETSISCSAGSDTVSYTVGVCPYNQNCDEDRVSAARNRVTVPVPRDSGVEHSFTVTAQTCGGRVETTSPPQLVNLTGITCNVYLKSYYYLYSLTGFTVESVNVSWPRFYVSFFKSSAARMS